ncbi:MAG: hypothetical protein KAI25_09730, partial [Hyphomicrobiaceae bacterium]|nr:hypothetical protein [Hyphomicrobiaceae bacterium]
MSIDHTAAGGVAPIDKSVTYGTVLTNIANTGIRRWITQNLGATNPAGSASDDTEPSAGWYWQFNRIQGYYQPNANGALISTATPNTWDNSNDATYTGWDPAKDPCTLLLGAGWRLPTGTEWFNADGAPQNWDNYNHTYASALRLHTAGFLNGSSGALSSRGSFGFYWSSTQSSSANGYNLSFSSEGSWVYGDSKAHCFSVRCLTIDDILDYLKIGNTITFTLTPAIAESGLTVSPTTYNGKDFSPVWTTVDSGTTYTATYTVIEGDTDQATPLQLTGVALTDTIGNTGASADSADVARAIDANAPSATSAPTAAAGPDINAAEETAGFDIVAGLSTSDAVAGDTLELLLDGAAFPTPLTRTLTADDITATSYTFIISSGQL